MPDGYASRLQELGRSLFDQAVSTVEVGVQALLQSNKYTRAATDFWGFGYNGGPLMGNGTPEIIITEDLTKPRGVYRDIILGFRHFDESKGEEPLKSVNEIYFKNGAIEGYKSGNIAQIPQLGWDNDFELWGSAERVSTGNYTGTYKDYRLLRDRERLQRRIVADALKHYVGKRKEHIGNKFGRNFYVARIPTTKSTGFFRPFRLFDPRGFDYKLAMHYIGKSIFHSISDKLIFKHLKNFVGKLRDRGIGMAFDPFIVAQWDASIEPYEALVGLPSRIDQQPYANGVLPAPNLLTRSYA